MTLTRHRYDRTTAERYEPDDDTRDFISKVYEDFRQDADLRRRPQRIFNDRSIEQVWSDSLDDYLLYVEPMGRDEWVRPYVSSIVRDKIRTEVALILANAARPQIVAQNREQDVDRVVARVLKIASEYAAKQDGAPSSSGQRKRLLYCIDLVLYGTVHVQEDMVDGRALRTVVPNEDVYVPNLWQTDIQKQSHVLRVSNNVTYEEAALAYGKFENWKYVRPGGDQGWWWNDLSAFKDYRSGVAVDDNRVQVVCAWYPFEDGRGWYQNTLINGVPLYEPEHKSPYRHGAVPLAKEVFEDLGCYWGDSLSNRCRHDKRWRDNWKTMLRAKQKLAIAPPFIAWNGLTFQQDIVVPNKVTEMIGNPENLRLVHEEFSKGVTAGDVQMLRLAEEEIERATTPDIVSGGEGRQVTARQIATQSAYSQVNQAPTVDRFFTLEAALEYMRIRNIVQFWPKKKIDGLARVVVPDQEVRGGARGTFEILFHPIPELDEAQAREVSRSLFREEEARAKEGEVRETVVIDPGYLRELSLFVTIEEKPVTDLEFLRQMDTYDRMIQNPVFNQEEVARDLVRSMGGDEDRLVRKPPEQQVPAGAAQGAPQGNSLTEAALGPGPSMGGQRIPSLASAAL